MKPNIDLPRRFKQVVEGKVLYGCYFPGTDLVIGQMGGRGTGRPKDVEWIDAIDPELQLKMVTFKSEGNRLRWQQYRGNNEVNEDMVAGTPYHMGVRDYQDHYELVENGYFTLIPKDAVELTEAIRGWAPEGYQRPSPEVFP